MIYCSAAIPLAKERAVFILKIFPVFFVCFFLLSAAAQSAPFANQWDWDNPPLLGNPRLIEETSGQQLIRTSYDSDGKRQRIDVLSLKGKAIAAMLFEYDNSGNLVKIQVYQAHNAHPLREEAHYENGRIVTMTGPHFPGNAAFEYDDKGRLDKIIIVDNKGNLTPAHWLFTWDDQNHLLVKGFYGPDEKLAGKEEFAYNEKGFESSRRIYDKDGKLVERRDYEYRYDKTGNWTRRTTTRITWEDGEEKNESVTTERKISYY